MSQVETIVGYLATVKGLIDEHGWAVQGVGGNEQNPIRCYTIGLTTWAHPEIVVVGFEPHLMTRIINDVGHQVKAGKQFNDWSVVREIIKNFPVVFRELKPKDARQAAGLVRRFFPRYRLLQMFFPDANGLFPWQDACNPGYKRQLCYNYVSTSDGIAIL